MSKKKYTKPKVISMLNEVQSGVPGALHGAALMVGRALAKSMKGGVDITAGINGPKTLQKRT